MPAENDPPTLSDDQINKLLPRHMKKEIAQKKEDDWKKDRALIAALDKSQTHSEDWKNRGMTKQEIFWMRCTDNKPFFFFFGCTTVCLVWGIGTMGQDMKKSNLLMRGRVGFQALAVASLLVVADPFDLGRTIRPYFGIRNPPRPGPMSNEYKDALFREWQIGDKMRSKDEVIRDMEAKMGWDQKPEWQTDYDSKIEQAVANSERMMAAENSSRNEDE